MHHRAIIAYDIACRRNRTKVAKRLASACRRIQRSVYLFEGTLHKRDRLLGELAEWIQPDDSLRCWSVKTTKRSDTATHTTHAYGRTNHTIVFDGQCYDLG